MPKLDLDLIDLKRVNSLSEEERRDLVSRLSHLKLLTPAHANSKTAKNDAKKYFSYILHLSPADLSGFNFCPQASAGCRAACLNTAGRGRFSSIQRARLRKSLYFVLFRKEFLRHLSKEIERAYSKATKARKKCVVRLNGTSDLAFETMGVMDSRSLIDLFPKVQFYDYTKIFARLRRTRPVNYSLTYSMSESNSESALAALGLGVNVAVVFNQIPSEYLGVEVLDGDSTDLRFNDKGRGVFIGLKAKGKAKQDTSGFVKQV